MVSHPSKDDPFNDDQGVYVNIDPAVHKIGYSVKTVFLFSSLAAVVGIGLGVGIGAAAFKHGDKHPVPPPLPTTTTTTTTIQEAPSFYTRSITDGPPCRAPLARPDGYSIDATRVNQLFAEVDLSQLLQNHSVAHITAPTMQRQASGMCRWLGWLSAPPLGHKC